MASVALTSCQDVRFPPYHTEMAPYPLSDQDVWHQELKEQFLPLIAKRMDSPEKVEIRITAGADGRSIKSCSVTLSKTRLAFRIGAKEAQGILLKTPLPSETSYDEFTEEEVAAALKSKSALPPSEPPAIVASLSHKRMVHQEMRPYSWIQNTNIVLWFGQSGMLEGADLSGVKASSYEKTGLRITLFQLFSSENKELAGKTLLFSLDEIDWEPDLAQAIEIGPLPDWGGPVSRPSVDVLTLGPSFLGNIMDLIASPNDPPPPTDQYFAWLHQELKEQLLPLIVRRLDSPEEARVQIYGRAHDGSIGSCVVILTRSGFTFGIGAAEAKGILLEKPLFSAMTNDQFTEVEAAAALKAKSAVPPPESRKAAGERERMLAQQAVRSALPPQDIKIVLWFDRSGLLAGADIPAKASTEEKTKLRIALCDLFSNGDEQLAEKVLSFSYKGKEWKQFEIKK